MTSFLLAGNDITKYFIRGRFIFKGINIALSNSSILGITGENGSGKTTLLRILSGIIPPTTGSLDLNINDKVLKRSEISSHIGYVSPYLTLYEEFNPIEHFQIFSKLRSQSFDEAKVIEYLKLFKLYNRRDEAIKTFSSGMKQRIKYILAFLFEPEILFLDEPFTNLDTAGIDTVKEIVTLHKSKGGGVIIASNDDREKELCESFVNISKFQ